MLLLPHSLTPSLAPSLPPSHHPFLPLQPAFVWEWYCSGREGSSSVPAFLRAFITGWLPALLLNLWLVMVLPRLVYLIVQSEGSCVSLSALERRIGAVFFYWDIFNVRRGLCSPAHSAHRSMTSSRSIQPDPTLVTHIHAHPSATWVLCAADVSHNMACNMG